MRLETSQRNHRLSAQAEMSQARMREGRGLPRSLSHGLSNCTAASTGQSNELGRVSSKAESQGADTNCKDMVSVLSAHKRCRWCGVEKQEVA
jgi:hypothetical protein